MNTSNDLGKLILRIAIGGLMLFHGLAKLDGVSGIADKFVSIGLPGILAYLVYIGEIIAPLMLILGFRSRIAGLLISATMLVAILLVHTDDVFSLSASGAWSIETAALYFLGGLAIYFLGGGHLALSRSNKWD